MAKRKRSEKRPIIVIAAILIAILAAGVLLFSKLSKGSQDIEQNSGQVEAVAQDISQAEAEQVCQDPAMLRQYVDIEAVDVVPADAYAPYYVDNGDGTKSLQWSGKYKNSSEAVFFACSVARDGEKVVVKRVTLY